ncbi:type A chloramphenicol O-acetyltransferase [Agathobaculum sp. TL06]
MKYTKIDLTEWSRGALFQFYLKHMRIVMSLTVDIDITPLLGFSKKLNLKFYPCMLWVVSKIVNSHDEFKYSWDNDGNLIRWECISPSYTEFHQEDESFTKYVTPYTEDLFMFHASYMADKRKHQNTRAFAEKQPPNFFDVSCLPWVRYQHFDVHVFDEGKFLAPVITWGKYEAEQEKYRMPLTMNIHHAVADGFHLSRFFNEVQELIDSLSETENFV